MDKLKLTLASLTVGLMMSSQSMAAIEINEDDFGPTYETMVADTVVGKPLQLISAVGSTAVFVASYPFAYVGGNTHQSKQKLFDEPWQAMNRCLGCSVAEDNFYKSQDFQNNAVRIVVNEPSELLINTDDKVIIDDYIGGTSQ